MDGNMIAALVVAAATFVAFALVALMFWQGKWLFLVAGRAAGAEGADVGERGGSAAFGGADGVRKLGRRMAVVLLIACVLVATLLLFEGAKLAGNAPLASAATMANNVAFVALLVGMVWFFIVQRPDREKDESSKQESRVAARARTARLDHLPMATILFSLALIALTALVGVLFANG